MKTSIFTLCMLTFFSSVKGQVNLVPNHSFEYYNECPNGSFPLGGWNPIPWNQDPTWSSDYFNVCGTNGQSVPQNFIGWQYPQDSNAYVGIGVFVHPSLTPEYREYIQVQLLDTLKAGRMYCVTFYVSVGDTGNYGISNIGAYFSPTPGGMNAATYYTFQPQISNPDTNFLIDKIGWTKISGTFVANGDERYMILGNFRPDSLTNYRIVDSLNTYPGQWHAYYYIDNVSVIELAPIDAGTSSVICEGDSIQVGSSPMPGVSYSWSPGLGLSDSTIANPIAFPVTTTSYTLTQTQCDAVLSATVTIAVRNDCDPPIPFFIPSLIKGDELLSISGLEPYSKLEIFDALGRRIFYSENYQNDFGGYDVAAATYIVQFTKPNGEIVKQKLCIVK